VARKSLPTQQLLQNFTDSIILCPIPFPRRTIPPMHPGPRLLLLFPLATLLACGSSSPSPSASTTSNFSNWQIRMLYGTSSTTVGMFTGALQISNGLVTGSLMPYPDASTKCMAPSQSFAVTGTLDASNNLILSVPMAGAGTATITAALPANPEAVTNGSFQIAGGTCVMSATPMTISQFASATGTYIGTLTVIDMTGNPVPGDTITATAVLTQSATPNNLGEFPLSGTITATGACNDRATLIGTLVAGGGLDSFVTGPVFIAEIDPTASTISGAVFIDPTAADTRCYAAFNGTLTRQ